MVRLVMLLHVCISCHPTAWLVLLLLLLQMVSQRADLFSVFLVIPTGFLRALASKQVRNQSGCAVRPFVELHLPHATACLPCACHGVSICVSLIAFCAQLRLLLSLFAVYFTTCLVTLRCSSMRTMTATTTATSGRWERVVAGAHRRNSSSRSSRRQRR